MRDMTSRFAATSTLAALLVTSACGDDSAGTGGGTSSTGDGGDSTTTATTSPASTGAGDGGGDAATTAAASTSGNGGDTGSGGTTGSGGAGGEVSWEGVDPLERAGDVELVQDGFSFVEGPLWLASVDVLRWSDIPPQRIHEIDAGDAVTIWRDDSGGSNGLALIPGVPLMIACEGAARQLTISPIDAPDFDPFVTEYEGDRLNAPNDAIVRTDRNVYFTDPDYGLPAGDHEIGFNGVYRVDPEGAVHLVDDGRDLPNGIALSPDESILYVADNGSSELWTYAIAEDGTTSEGVLLTETAGGPDGMAVDDAGNLYVTTVDGIDVRRADGTPWGVIPVPETPANCTFGGVDRNVLWITARTGLYRVQMVIPGLP
jgi:gluconolactonase